MDRRPANVTTLPRTSPATTDNDLLDPGETWEFTCQNAVDGLTINIARIAGQPSDADGSPLPVPR